MKPSRSQMHPDVESYEGEFDVQTVLQLWQAIPPHLKAQLAAMARQSWNVRGALLARLVATTFFLIRRYRLPPVAAMHRAARQLRIPHRRRPGYPGKISKVQARQSLRRQLQRLPKRRRKRSYQLRRY